MAIFIFILIIKACDFSKTLFLTVSVRYVQFTKSVELVMDETARTLLGQMGLEGIDRWILKERKIYSK